MKLPIPSLCPLTTDSVIQATEWLTNGKLLAYPTESVWGIGCDPFDQQAVQQLLAIKQRPVDKGMIVVTDSIDHILPLLQTLESEQQKMVVDSWQLSASKQMAQAHTWLLPLPQSLTIPIPYWITGKHNSVAVRVITHPLIQQLCAQLVSPSNPYGFIVSTSCNPSGQMPALSLSQAQAYFLNDDFVEQVYYLQGNTLDYQMPSQIRDALTGQVVR